MSPSHDLVIRRGTIIDGTGRPGFIGDVAINQGAITAFGNVAGSGKEEIDAKAKLVTPGFVDLHTHYDGQVTWSNRMSSSGEHGVTTVLMGNCGVGFAPCRPQDRERLIHLMEGIEDIPEAVMAEGLPWSWQTFPDYIDQLAQRSYDVDIAVQLPHAPLRVYVMGQRAFAREPATSDDIEQMRRLTREAIAAGAFGFSTSRNLSQQALDGTVTPSYAASADELGGIARGLRDANGGILQFSSDFSDIESDFSIMRRMMADSGRPLSLSVVQMHRNPDGWRRYLEEIARATRDGFCIKGQVSSRFVGVFLGLHLVRNPFMRTPAFRELEHLSFAERIRRMKDPRMRARILGEMPGDMTAVDQTFMASCDAAYEFVGDYEPEADKNLGLRARALGTDSAALAYDILTAGNGTAVLCLPLANFAHSKATAVEAMLFHEHTVLGNGDAGAHLGLIFDASMSTYMIQRWSNIGRGTIPIERVIKGLTSEIAKTMCLNGRGVIAVGFRADLNVIDPSRIGLGPHHVISDLPGGRPRLHQSASGYEATIVAGEITYRDGIATDALPGRLIKSASSSKPC
jgi:N-acyl-D-amino-acid deacylase